jgi:hypothetical protein
MEWREVINRLGDLINALEDRCLELECQIEKLDTENMILKEIISDIRR